MDMFIIIIIIIIIVISSSSSSSISVRVEVFIVFSYQLVIIIIIIVLISNKMNRPLTDNQSLSLIIKRKQMAPISNRFDRTFVLNNRLPVLNVCLNISLWDIRVG